MTKDQLIEQAQRALDIKALNAMQEKVLDCWCDSAGDLVVYSPTGSGKTLAFAMAALMTLDPHASETPQVLVIAPSRELVIQIAGVIKKLSPLTLVTSCYGGHQSADESNSLRSRPLVVISTPGRLVDHINQGNIELAGIKSLVLDEFDKSLELGFSDEMSTILRHCPDDARKILTSATVIEHMPRFVKLNNCHTINMLASQALAVDSRLTLWHVAVQGASPLDTLLKLLLDIPNERTIVFANTRESAQQAFLFLMKNTMPAALYHGALEQIEREKAVTLFNNGSVMVLVATDLAARGLDIASVKHIIHYELPLTQEVFTHRNGRSARIDATGDVYLITTPQEPLPHYTGDCKQYIMKNRCHAKRSSVATMYISAGKKEKISRGDILGFLSKNSTATAPGDIGAISIFDHYALVALPAAKIEQIIKEVSPFKLKKQKVKLSVARPQLRFAKR